MFEVGWTEMLVIAIVMIVVVGPKDLPNMLRTFGRTVAKLRAMAGDFQKQFNEALKEAELDDVKKSVDELRGLNPAAQIRKQLNPFEQAAADVRSGVDNMMKPKPAEDPATPAASEPQAAEPLKNGATVLPGVNGPEAMPATPVVPAAEPVAAAVAAAGPAKRKPTAKPVKAAVAVAAKPATTKAAQRPAGSKAVTKPVVKASAVKPELAAKAPVKPAKTVSTVKAPAKKTARTAK
ncbi:MAG TPA: Sec-independent protein translocase protein TatB [Mesorhizobium sp.]|jgi:sec-independent protein translocase protein TatB|uniref:Sec-independent protein translocase protein TatB n=1 Tax=Mesorhizobium sp. TaxID=1871066 RepID=UPI002DDDAE85|nr:Sec-independent protein translocase protein TatB [Mesorhizobium sp.]HEV2506844.1 Sec-independent protein translocase protein TatB [Mesorhizobium sp.]